MTIRPATLHDIPAILEIEQLAFSSPWTEAHFRYELSENPYAFIFVATIDDHVVGYLDFWITFQQAQINNLAVHPSLKRKGIAKTLLRDGLSRISAGGCSLVTLEVRVSNLAAQALYLQYGFTIAITKPKYYANGEDAFLMEKKL